MNKSFLKELPELIKANLISPETAKQIEIYYQHKEEAAPNRITIILGILGALLAGSGIVLLIAHNWDEFSNGLKTIFAFLPLIIGQGFCLYTLLKRKDSELWKEGSAVFLFFGVMACVALISQIYHIDGKLISFLLTVALLTVPLVYLMGSSAVSLLYIGTATWYACEVGYAYSGTMPYMYLVMVLLILPHYWQLYRKKNNFFYLHNWMLSVSFVITLGAFAFHDSSDTGTFSVYLSLFCLYYLAGRSFLKTDKLFLNSYLIVGTAGILFVLLFWSFIFMWDDIVDRGTQIFKGSLFGYITIVLLLISGWIIFDAWKKKTELWKDPTGLSSFIFFISLFAFAHLSSAGAFIMNLWIIIIAVYYINRGAKENHLGILNFGLVIIALLATFRFFDDRIPFVWRGLLFLAAGAGFFIANYLMLKKRKLTRQN